jgi:alpha-tubulin suppressor-like RCC1 family protein
VAVSTSGVLFGKNITKISSMTHVLALSKDNKLYGWGPNSAYQLYDDSSATKLLPIEISPPILANKTIIDIQSGPLGSAVLTSDGIAYYFGSNKLGTAGSGLTEYSTTYVTLSSLTNVAKLAAGYDHCVALTLDGKLYTWGAIFGLGLGGMIL